MKLALICAGVTLGLLAILAWLMSRIHYRIGSKHLKIVLFGFAIRQIPLDQIVYASKREPSGMAERWYSTFKTSHRLLTIERSRGLRKFVCITPRNRYAFLGDLKRAVLRVNPSAEWATPKSFEDVTQPKGKAELGELGEQAR